jgi:dipeptidyl aminopeptidase/acylaminoacyl peptidase
MIWSRIARRSLLTLVAAGVSGWLGLSAPAIAQTPTGTKVPMESFFKKAQFLGAALNPAGTHLAYIREVNGRYNLVAMDVATRKLTSVAGYDRADVVSFNWINDARLMYSITDAKVAPGDVDVSGTYAVDLDGGKPYPLSAGLVSYGLNTGNRGIPARADFYARSRSGDRDDIIVVQYASSPFRTTLMRVNTRSGLRKPIEPGGLTNVIRWALDANDVPRAALSMNDDRVTAYVRDSESTPWRKVAEFSQFENEGFAPLRVDKAGNLFVAAAQGKDTSAIYRFDWAKGAPEAQPIASVKDFDIASGLMFDGDEDALIGVRYEAAQEGTHWIHPAWKAHQEAVDAALPGRVNTLSGKAENVILVRTESDTSPARYFLFDTKAKKLSLLGVTRPWIDEKTQSKSDVIRYAARDGMTIPALLTLPRGVEPKNLPLVLLAHGGPYVRGIDWGWARDRQFLASRGYAVLEPDFRGSMGHGWKLFRAGWKQWGLGMQDDLADGVADLVKRGVVDKNRVCIAGASYGGYATVMGLIQHPDVYRCGISWVGVTDIELLYTVGWSDGNNSPEARLGLEVLVGDPKKDKAQLTATSAIAQAARLKAPLILAYGLVDVRVPYDHGRQLRDALKPHNPQLDYVEYAGEGHGWRQLETNIDFWTRAEKLLTNTIGK